MRKLTTTTIIAIDDQTEKIGYREIYVKTDDDRQIFLTDDDVVFFPEDIIACEL